MMMVSPGHTQIYIPSCGHARCVCSRVRSLSLGPFNWKCILRIHFRVNAFNSFDFCTRKNICVRARRACVISGEWTFDYLAHGHWKGTEGTKVRCGGTMEFGAGKRARGRRTSPRILIQLFFWWLVPGRARLHASYKRAHPDDI